MQIHHHSATKPLDFDSDNEEDDDAEGEDRQRWCDGITTTLDRLKVTTPVSEFCDEKCTDELFSWGLFKVSSKEGYLTKLGRIRKVWTSYIDCDNTGACTDFLPVHRHGKCGGLSCGMLTSATSKPNK